MSLGENSLVAAYQGRGQLKSRPSGTRVVTEFFQETGRTQLAHTLLNSSSKASRHGCESCARISEVMVSSPGLVFFLHLDKAIRKAVMLKGSLKYWSSAGSCPPWSSSECSSSKADLRSWNSTE